MPSALLSSAQKDIIGSQARDYTALVRQVKDILPQFSDDQVCDALVQSDEDISRAVELLMSQQPTTKQSKKKEKHKNREARAEAEATATATASAPTPSDEKQQYAEEPVIEPKDERPKTPAEKEAAKLRKKLREIERIEEKVAKGEKVDPLQLPKLDKKRETEMELRAAEQKIQQEEEERRYQEEEARKQEEYERQRQAQEAVRRRQEEAAQRAAEAEARILPEPARQQHSWLGHRETPLTAPPPVAPEVVGDPHQHMRSELLSILHKAPQENKEKTFTQSEQTASYLGGGSFQNLVAGAQRPAAPADDQRDNYRSEQQGYQRPYSQQYNNYGQYSQQYGQQYGQQHGQQYGHQQSRYQDWKQDDWRGQRSWNKPAEAPPEKARHDSPPAAAGEEKPKTDWANMYSTQLDISSIPADMRAEAERIAKEIEQNSGGGDGWEQRPDTGSRPNGKGDYGGKNGGKSYGYGKGKGGGKSKTKGKGKPRDWSKDGGRSEWPKYEDWPKADVWAPKAEDWGPPGL